MVEEHLRLSVKQNVSQVVLAVSQHEVVLLLIDHSVKGQGRHLIL